MMRGRSFLKESCSQSLCAVCAHRLGATRQLSHVQRRFLQSSRPASRPPAEAAALREDNGNDNSFSHQRGPVANSWGRAVSENANALGPGAGWGRPAFSSGIPSAGPPGSWRNQGGDAIPAAQGTSGASQSNETAVPIELLPHEKRARNLLIEQQRTAQMRSVNIPSGPGPESNRAGRQLPKRRTEERTLPRTRQENARKAWEDNRQHKQDVLNGRAGPRIIFQKLAEKPQATEQSPNSPVESREPQWAGLRRRGATSEQRDLSSQQDPFEQARLQREQQAKSRKYTPLGSRSIFDSQNKSLHSNPANRSIDLSPTTNERQENLPLDSRTTDNRSDSVVRFSAMALPRDTQGKQDEIKAETEKPAFANQAKKAAIIEENPAYSRAVKPSRASSRFSSEISYNEAPKGKGKDKARRRQHFYEEDAEDEMDQLSRKRELRKQRKREKAEKKAAAAVPILLPEYISVANLAVALRVRFEDFVAKMEELGFEETSHDHILNSETAGLIAMEYNFDPIIDRSESEDIVALPPAEDKSLLPQRPPVVTIMGHVDHGKTTLLDWLRKSSVAASEHGGITQHIGAFSVPMPGGKIITFLDTPGHAAFLSMRQRGANVTDIVILVVAADDSVKPQTIEAINHAKAAKVPIIVAINKIDKEDSDVERVKQDLSRHGVEIEDYGGDTQVICVSGKTGQGMEDLEEAAVTLSEILDMRAEKDGQAEGWVLEASIKPVGKVATVLVRRGTMRPGDFIVAGNTWARIRCLRNEAGVSIAEAGPGMPVEIDGWKDQPLAGDEALQVPDEGKAKSVINYRLERDERNKLAQDMEAINEIRKDIDETREREKQEALLAENDDTGTGPTSVEKPGGPKQVYFIVKGDVSGSVEAVIDSINSVGNGEVQPHILRSGVGQVNEFDIEHAAAANGHVISFNTTVDENISSLAKGAKVTILDSNIIYRLIDDVKATLSEHLAPTITQRVLGEAEIAQVFEITVKGRTTKAIAGCKVRNGLIGRNAKVRVTRQGEKVFDGGLASLKNQKKDAMEMRKGTECGMSFEDWFEFQVGDQVQSYEEKEEKRYL